MRITASWFGSLARLIQGCEHDLRAHQPAAPADFVIPTRSSVPSCSKPSRTKPSVGANARPSLTASARAGDADVQVGAKKRAARSNKETEGREMDRTLGEPP